MTALAKGEKRGMAPREENGEDVLLLLFSDPKVLEDFRNLMKILKLS
jgi:hypothetical protein